MKYIQEKKNRKNNAKSRQIGTESQIESELGHIHNYQKVTDNRN